MDVHSRQHKVKIQDFPEVIFKIEHRSCPELRELDTINYRNHCTVSGNAD